MAVQLWRLGGVRLSVEEVIAPAVVCLCYEALIEWHFGELASCQTTMAEAVALAKDGAHALAQALFFAAYSRPLCVQPAEVERLASDLIELSARQNFAFWLAGGAMLRGWAWSASGDTVEGISEIEGGIEDYRATGSMLGVPLGLALKAEALHLAARTLEALDAISDAEKLVERSGERWWCAELHRLRGVFLAAMGAEDIQIEASFCESIRTAREQKSISLAKRAESSRAEYRRQKASGSGGHGFQLPLY